MDDELNSKKCLLRKRLNLPRDAYLWLLPLGHVDDIDPVDEDVFQAAPEVELVWKVGLVGLDHPPYVELGRETGQRMTSWGTIYFVEERCLNIYAR